MTRVVIIEDHPVFRDGLARAVQSAPGLSLTMTYRSIEEFDAEPCATDVAVLDLNLPGLGGAGGVQHVRAAGPRVLVLSASATQELVLDAMASGASGYLTKDAETEEIVRAIATVAAGSAYVSPTLAGFLLAAHRKTGPPGTELTAREREVLSLVARGERDQDIAEDLFISIRTVRSHLDRIRDKTGRRRRPDLTRLALEQGIIVAGESEP